jgi:hypothetical protein
MSLGRSNAVPGDKPDPRKPYLSAVSDHPAGPNVVASGGTLIIAASGLQPKASAVIRIDGKTFTKLQIDGKGNGSTEHRVGDDVPLGLYQIEVLQTSVKRTRRAATIFIKVKQGDPASGGK